uniref:Uncharacterized protein n=1 Tax=Glossina brevipalpis TaxID=37001 RepID=A0A1A9W4S3_9MUSC
MEVVVFCGNLVAVVVVGIVVVAVVVIIVALVVGACVVVVLVAMVLMALVTIMDGIVEVTKALLVLKPAVKARLLSTADKVEVDARFTGVVVTVMGSCGKFLATDTSSNLGCSSLTEVIVKALGLRGDNLRSASYEKCSENIYIFQDFDFLQPNKLC